MSAQIIPIRKHGPNVERALIKHERRHAPKPGPSLADGFSLVGVLLLIAAYGVIAAVLVDQLVH